MLVAPTAAQPSPALASLGGVSTPLFTVVHTTDGQMPPGVSTLGAFVRAKDLGSCQQKRLEKGASARKRSD